MTEKEINSVIDIERAADSIKTLADFWRYACDSNTENLVEIGAVLSECIAHYATNAHNAAQKLEFI